MTIRVIVLTGGPCGGKTTAKAHLKQVLPQFGITPVFIPEAATILLGSGIDVPRLFSLEHNPLKFQDILFQTQLGLEARMEQLAKLHSDTVLICDRGVFDGAAYVSQSDFEEMTSKHCFTLADLRSRYDLVIHLVTAADGATEFYNLDNSARVETQEQARELDAKLQSAWSGHSDLRIIPNIRNNQQISFGEKMDWLVEEVMAFLGLPIPIQSQRKYLLSQDTNLMSLPVDCTRVEIRQTYLTEKDGVERRVSRWSYGANDPIYFYTEKEAIGKGSLYRFRREDQITPDDYILLLGQRDRNRQEISKSRYCFVWDHQYFNVDVFRQPDSLFLLEVQTSRVRQEVVIPDFLDVIREVTDDPSYLNASIALSEP